MRGGFLPIRTREFPAHDLERAGLLVCIAPARRFSEEEIAAVRRFVEQGGTFLCLVGAEEARPIAGLLEEFQIKVTPSPVRVGEEFPEPYPLGAAITNYKQSDGTKHEIQFYAAWPVDSLDQKCDKHVESEADGRLVPVVISKQVGAGTVGVIADTNFAINRNLESAEIIIPQHIEFLESFLMSITNTGEQNSPAEPVQEQGPMKSNDLIPEQGPQ